MADFAALHCNIIRFLLAVPFLLLIFAISEQMWLCERKAAS